ncbi:hypothetical protein ABKA04_001295 [Annulohypoxylon sp. FPYF3050]
MVQGIENLHRDLEHLVKESTESRDAEIERQTAQRVTLANENLLERERHLEKEKSVLAGDQKALGLLKQRLEISQLTLVKDREALEAGQQSLKVKEQDLEQRIQAATQSQIEGQKRLSELSEMISKIAKTQADLASQRSAEDQTIVELARKLVKVENEKKTLDANVVAAEKAAQTASAKINDLQMQMDKEREQSQNIIANLETQLSSSSSKILVPENMNLTLKSDSNATSASISELKRAKLALEVQLESSNSTISDLEQAKNTLQSEKAELEEWKSSACLIFGPPRKRSHYWLDEEEEGQQFNEWISWRGYELDKIMRNLVCMRPIVADGSSLTPDQWVSARTELLKEMFGIIIDDESRLELREFMEEAFPHRWYCLEAVVKYTHNCEQAIVDENDRCSLHNSCIFIKQAPEGTHRGGILCRKVSREPTPP